jgi:hypothetical protein
MNNQHYFNVDMAVNHNEFMEGVLYHILPLSYLLYCVYRHADKELSIMEQRRFERKQLIFKATIISRDNRYKGVIKNISENGAYIEIVPTKEVHGFVPQTTLEVALQLPSGQDLTLRCEVIWLYSKKSLPPDLKQNSIGVEFIEPSRELNDLLKTIQ